MDHALDHTTLHHCRQSSLDVHHKTTGFSDKYHPHKLSHQVDKWVLLYSEVALELLVLPSHHNYEHRPTIKICNMNDVEI